LAYSCTTLSRCLSPLPPSPFLPPFPPSSKKSGGNQCQCRINALSFSSFIPSLLIHSVDPKIHSISVHSFRHVNPVHSFHFCYSSIIYSSRILCLSSCRPVIFLSYSCHSCGTLSYSLCFSDQTDQGIEREGVNRLIIIYAKLEKHVGSQCHLQLLC
jgi:hypothetical protein